MSSRCLIKTYVVYRYLLVNYLHGKAAVRKRSIDRSISTNHGSPWLVEMSLLIDCLHHTLYFAVIQVVYKATLPCE